MTQDPIPIKLVAVGDKAANKTVLLMRYCKREVPTAYVPTVFDGYSVTVSCSTRVSESTNSYLCSFYKVTMDNKLIEVGLYDTAGQEEYDRLRPLSYANSDGLLVAFSVDSRESMANIKDKWMQEINHYRPDAKVIIVATNIERRSAKKPEGAGECISQEEGLEFARQMAKKYKNVVGYRECSAQTGRQVTKTFHDAVRAVVVDDFAEKLRAKLLGTNPKSLALAKEPEKKKKKKKQKKES